MLLNTTIEGLKTLRLDAMAAALAEQHEQAAYSGLGFEERLGLLVDRELTERASRRIERSLKTARLRAPATVEDIDFRHPRGLDRAHILDLAQAHWAAARRAIVITGPTGTGKTYLACALANAAIRNGHTALYLRAPRMLDDLAVGAGDGQGVEHPRRPQVEGGVAVPDGGVGQGAGQVGLPGAGGAGDDHGAVVPGPVRLGQGEDLGPVQAAGMTEVEVLDSGRGAQPGGFPG